MVYDVLVGKFLFYHPLLCPSLQQVQDCFPWCIYRVGLIFCKVNFLLILNICENSGYGDNPIAILLYTDNL